MLTPVDPNLGLVFWTLSGASPPSSLSSVVLTNDGDSKFASRTYNTTGGAVCAGAWDMPLPVDGVVVSTVIASYIGRTTTNGTGTGKNTQSRLRINGVDYTSSGIEPWGSTSYSQKDRTWLVNPATGLFWRPSDIADIEGMGAYKNDVLVSVGQVRLTQWWLTVTYLDEPRKVLRGRRVAAVSPYGRMIVVPEVP